MESERAFFVGHILSVTSLGPWLFAVNIYIYRDYNYMTQLCRDY